MGKKPAIYTQADIDALTQGKRYVFYSSLKKEPSEQYHKLYLNAQDIIDKYKYQFGTSANNPKMTTGTKGNGIERALKFLQDSAEFERQKELLFFSNFESAHPEIKDAFNISAKDITNDYEMFIININRAIKGTEQLKKELKVEMDRIKKNQSSLEQYYKDKKELNPKSNNYQDDLSKLQRTLAASRSRNNSIFYMKANGQTAFQSLFKNNGHMHILSTLIIEKFGHRLFDKNLKLNERQTAALIAAVTMKANELFLSVLKIPTMKTTMEKTASDVINGTEMENFINALLSTPGLRDMVESIMNQYDISHKTKKKINDLDDKIERIKKELEKNHTQLVRSGKTNLGFDDWLKQIGMTEDKIKKIIQASSLISTQCYYVGEDLSMMDLVSNHIRAVLGGNTNPTDDIYAGKLITMFEFDDQKLNELEDSLWEKARTTFLTKVDKTTTFDSYRENINALVQARKEQQDLIDQFIIDNDSHEKVLKELLQHMNIHSTVKGYESAGSEVFAQNGGFGGAAFGSTLQDQLDIIYDMIMAGGLDMQFDVEDLYIAMINCGKLMIGVKLKPILVNYLSAFMGMFMFNDASLFANDVKNWIDNEKILSNNVQDLHLYQLNGIIVPSSYILQKTYDAMSSFSNFDKHYQGIQAEFTTYDKDYFRGQWELTSTKAIDNTKLERMHFLAGFFDLLDNISLRLSNIN